MASDSDSEDEHIDFLDTLVARDRNTGSLGDEYGSDGDQTGTAVNDSDIPYNSDGSGWGWGGRG